MSEWKTYKLGEVFTFSSGLSKAREYFGSGYDFVAFKDIFANIFLPEKLSSLVQSNEIERKSCSVLRGDVFLTRTSETYNELGISSVALNDYPNATFNGFTKRLRPNGNIIIVPEYAGYYFRSPKFRSLVTQYSSITTRASLNNEILSNLTIDIPIVALQTEIGKILKSLDDKIELNLQMNQTLEAMAQAIFKEWFVNFNFPKSLNRDSCDLYDDNDAENHNNQTNQKNHSADKLVDGLPKGWSYKTIKNLGKVVTGNTPSSKNPEYFGETTPFVTPTDFKYFGKLIIEANRYLSVEGSSAMKTRLLPKHSIIVTCIGSDMGKVAINSIECVTNQQINSIIPNDKSFVDYLYYDLVYKYDYLRNIATGGSTMPIINKSRFEEIEILTPSSDVLENFQALMDSFNSKIEENIRQIQSLTQIRDSLLPKLMTGKIEIKE